MPDPVYRGIIPRPPAQDPPPGFAVGVKVRDESGRVGKVHTMHRSGLSCSVRFVGRRLDSYWYGDLTVVPGDTPMTRADGKERGA